MSGPLSYFLSWRERRQDRHRHEPLENQEEHDGDQPLQELDSPTNTQQPSATNTNNGSTVVVETVVNDDDDDADDDADEENQIETDRSDGSMSSAPSATISVRPSMRTVTLAELEEERELSRRRTSICILLSSFILFRLWIQAIATHDFFLLVICMIGTSWTARFIRHTRDREEELDRLIADYSENPEGNAERTDVRMLSFQAQLALAIMESQRDLMRGGFGSPDGHSNNSPGVSDEAKERWDRFQFNPKTFYKRFKDSYGSVAQNATDKSGHASDEEPHCSICLSEYEEGDDLVCLPCQHVYHDDCVSSWTSNHVRCPLCNFDLESGSEEAQEV